jgi:hypothetical protein
MQLLDSHKIVKASYLTKLTIPVEIEEDGNILLYI